MASLPRPARAGKKIEATTPPAGSVGAGVSPEADLKLPAADNGASVSPPATATAPALPSFLEQGSLLSFAQGTETHVALGVVRGRGSKGLVEEGEMTANKEEAVSKWNDAVEKVSVASTTAPNRPLSAVRIDIIDKKQHAVVLFGDEDSIPVPCRIVSTKPDAIVALVVPHLYDAMIDEACALLGCKRGDLVGTWTRSTLQASAGRTRLFFIDQATFATFLSAEAVFGPFTHICLAHADCGTAMYELLYYEIRRRLTGSTTTTKIVICGASHTEANFVNGIKAFFNGAAVAKSDAPSHAVTAFSADEVVALTNLPLVKVAVRSMAKLDEQQLPHPKQSERVAEIAVALVSRLVADAKRDFNIVICGAEAPELQARLQRIELSSGEKLSVLFGTWESIAPCSGRTNVLLMGQAFHRPSQLRFAVDFVVDLGTEKVSFIVNKNECAYPVRRTEWESREERHSRLGLLGWAGPGIYASLLPEEEQVNLVPIKPHPTAYASLEQAVLHCARVGIHPSALLQETIHPPSADAVESALTTLADACAIVSPRDPTITFFGELLCRTGLPLDFALLVALGIVFGLEQLSVIAASLCALPLRPHAAAGVESEGWLSAANAAMKDPSVGTHSDLVADVACYLDWLAAGSDESAKASVCSRAVVEEKCFEELQHKIQAVLHSVADFIPPAPVQSPADLQRQLAQQHSALELFITAALARRAVVVRTEGEIAGRGSSGSMMFVRSNKDAFPHGFLPTRVTWKNGNVVIPASVTNTASRFFVGECTTLHANFFFSALLLLFPNVDFTTKQMYQEEECICFSVSVARQDKRFRTDVDTAARILDFRENVNVLLGAVLARRSLPPRTTLAQFAAHLAGGENKRFDLAELRQNMLTELADLVHHCELKEYQAFFSTHKTHLFAPTIINAVHEVSPATDVQLAKDLATLIATAPEEKIGIAEATAATAGGFQRPVFEEDDDVEMEGHDGFLRAGPIIEED